MLDGYIAAGVRLPWVWGETDCTMWVADWCKLRFGHDPAAAFRGAYDDEAGAARLIAGGLAETIRPWMPPLRETASPVSGDVGIVCVDGRQVAAICCGPVWAFRTVRGICEAPLKPLIAWGE
ncbi:DUF6950 family protein [Paracoccus sp. (in: a-proteobacteria)]|uniref:DUF6950 family protein n=1 Tax=Paracoccus sp. TaxID=267 RepID=UPI00272C910C|nr:hypothetical protein [Paracoccus sp. (in: a-proteobacteria)]